MTNIMDMLFPGKHVTNADVLNLFSQIAEASRLAEAKDRNAKIQDMYGEHTEDMLDYAQRREQERKDREFTHTRGQMESSGAWAPRGVSLSPAPLTVDATRNIFTKTYGLPEMAVGGGKPAHLGQEQIDLQRQIADGTVKNQVQQDIDQRKQDTSQGLLSYIYRMMNPQRTPVRANILQEYLRRYQRSQK